VSVGVRGLGVQLGSRVVLDGISAVFHAGELTCLMGPSGAGKTTLLAAIAGYVPPTRGVIDIEEDDRARLAFVAQSTPLLLRRTAADNVALGALARGAGWNEALLVAESLLSSLSMRELTMSRGYTLSGGERQRVAILRAIAQAAPIILADEPTASLDPINKSHVVRALRAAADQGATVIVATHDPFVAGASDKVVEL